jgi:hypothetical protein
MQQQGKHLSREWALLKDPVLHTERLDAIRQKKGYIIDMDGVIYHVSLSEEIVKISVYMIFIFINFSLGY